MRTVTRLFITLLSLGAAPIAVAAGCGGGSQQTSGTGATSMGGSTGSGHGGNTSTSSSGGAGATTSGSSSTGFGGGSGGGASSAGGGASVTGAGGGTSSAAASSSATTGAGGLDAGSADASDAAVVISVVKCLNQIYACGDGIDNDGDGLIDWEDPDCLGPCDNTEDSYYGGIPGQSGPNCDVDCYWDSNSGAGDDDCRWNHKCDLNEQGAPGHPEPIAKCAYNPGANISGTNQTCAQLDQQQSATCLSFCGPITPNGCDCFGCCELPASSGKFVWLGSVDEATNMGSCTAAVLNDPTKCEPCQPVPGCLNTCAKCELCIGKTTLPPECFPDGGVGDGGSPDGGTSTQCPTGVQPCGLPGEALCPLDYYCITGCCVAHM
ncbi:MAG: hypothetical protein ABJE95_14460 [Byssovorax sp.]